jgi:GNAT superfamily N-acetyltransferase
VTAPPERAEVRLRPAGEADEPLLRELFRAARPELLLLPLPPDQLNAMVDLQQRAQTLGYHSAHPAAVDLVVEREGRAVGRLLVDEGPPVTVVDIAVLPDDRGSGVGTAALQEVLAQADRRGVETRLHVRIGSPARRLYERLGFVAVPGPDDAVDLLMVRHPRLTTWRT